MKIEEWNETKSAPYLLLPDEDSDKYRRGVLALRTGSAAYPGAAVLGVEAAWRTGLGLLRYIPQIGDVDPSHGLPTPASAVLAARPETVFGSDTESDVKCDAWVIGSGTDAARRSFAETQAVARLLTGTTPVVLDAGALTVLHSVSGAPQHEARTAPEDRPLPMAPIIITPHRGEFLQLWREFMKEDPLPDGWPASRKSAPHRDAAPARNALAAAASQLAAHLGVTVLLKGSLTICATPQGGVASSGPATPWLATAGTGDVLAGLLGALVASHSSAVKTDPALLGALGVTAALIHDGAARIASGPGEQRAITAMDVALALPEAMAAIRARTHPESRYEWQA